MKKEKIPCIKCGAMFLPYPDFRGGDIGGVICRKCSKHRDGSIDRSNPKELKRYLEDVCPFHPLADPEGDKDVQKHI